MFVFQFVYFIPQLVRFIKFRAAFLSNEEEEEEEQEQEQEKKPYFKHEYQQ